MFRFERFTIISRKFQYPVSCLECSQPTLFCLESVRIHSGHSPNSERSAQGGNQETQPQYRERKGFLHPYIPFRLTRRQNCRDNFFLSLSSVSYTVRIQHQAISATRSHYQICGYFLGKFRPLRKGKGAFHRSSLIRMPTNQFR